MTDIAEIIVPDQRLELVLKGVSIGKFTRDELFAMRNAIDCSLGLKPSVDRIIQAVCDQYEISRGEILGSTRPAGVIWPRFIAIWLVREITRATHHEIGVYFGGRDHSAITYAIQRVADRCDTEPDFKHETDILLSALRLNKTGDTTKA